MKYKIFIKAILSMSIVLGYLDISGMTEKEDKSQRDTAKKSSPEGGMTQTPAAATRKAPLTPISPTKTGQQKLDELKSAPSSSTVKESTPAEDTNVKRLPLTGAIVPRLVAPPSVPKPLPQGTSLSSSSKSVTSTQPTAPKELSKSEQQKLDELNKSFQGLPGTSEVKEKAVARETEDDKVKYLPGTGIRVPVLSLPTGYKPKPLESTKPIEAKPLSAESTEAQIREAQETTRKQTETQEQQESIKKQTSDLEKMGLSALEVKYLMGMAPQERDVMVKKLQEAQATKNTAAKKPIPLIDLETSLKETNKKIADQEAESKKLDQEISRLQSDIRKLSSKTSESNKKALAAKKAQLEETQRKAIEVLKNIGDLELEKNALERVAVARNKATPQPTTKSNPVEALTQISDPVVTRQIEEITKTKEILNLSQEQKALAASLGDSAIDTVSKMSEEEIKLLPAEDKLKLFQIITARGMLVNAAKISIERQEEIRANFLKNPANKGKAFPETDESMKKETQEKFAFSTEIPRANMPPEEIAKIRIETAKSATEKANATLQKLGTDVNLRLGALTQIKNQIDELSKKTNLTTEEKQSLKDANEKYISRYLDLSQNPIPAKRAPIEQKNRLDIEFGNFVKQNPETVKTFLAAQEEKAKLVSKQLADSNKQLGDILGTKKALAAMKKAEALTKKIDAMEPQIDKLEKKKKEIEKKIKEDGEKLGPKKVAALTKNLKTVNKNIEKVQQKRKALSNASRKLMDIPGKKPLEDKIRISQGEQNELQQQIKVIKGVLEA